MLVKFPGMDCSFRIDVFGELRKQRLCLMALKLVALGAPCRLV